MPEARRGTAFVTGGSSGIGFAVARALLADGFAVALCARDASRLEQAAARLRGLAPGAEARVFAASADVARAADVQRWVAEACAQVGEPDVLVNNAGVGAEGAIAELSEAAWDRAMAINVKGAFLCTREVLPHMRRRGGGWIVNIASLAGKKGMPGVAAYCASKFALVGFTESLAREEARHNIRATAICPGYVATPMVAGAPVDAAEMIRPEDIAATVLYLLALSPKAVVREIILERLGSL